MDEEGGHHMAKRRPAQLSRREREIMDIIYRRGRATAAEVLDGMASPPGYSPAAGSGWAGSWTRKLAPSPGRLDTSMVP